MSDGNHSDAARHFTRRGSLRQGLSSFQVDGLFTDLTINYTNGKEHKVHKILVCSQSRFFHNACKPDSPFKEAQTGVIELEDDPDFVGAMVNYFYNGNYVVQQDAGYNRRTYRLSEAVNKVFFHAKYYVIAEKYEFHAMQQYALDEVEECFQLGKIWTEPEAYPELIRYAYENIHSSDRGLRAVLLGICQRYLPGLMMNKAFVDTMDSIDGFWSELLCC
ncbi:BTB/POZ domain containing protein [Neofusicoccum parvum]|uniref:BTB/POZ domain containing protein n=1 Tax=Neofusicoccum parvum TaxID=310453 RepID=A0ACB5RQI2_9PEZI|nr:BTB/POZ domain containing protein [Neofusicoccum parvum]